MNTITVKVDTVFDNGMIVTYVGDDDHVTYMGALIRQAKVVDPYRSAKVKKIHPELSFDTPLTIVDSSEITEKLDSASEMNNNLTNHLRNSSAYCESLTSDMSITISSADSDQTSPSSRSEDVCVVLCDQPLNDCIDFPYSNYSRKSKSKAYRKIKEAYERSYGGEQDHKFNKRRKRRTGSLSNSSSVASSDKYRCQATKPIPHHVRSLPIKPFSLKLSKIAL